ncbi:hypothetical protein JOF56_003251 [Kibdelosporangium banguiense]|uniref:DUF3592 domain-containing protein n=1 Tax=Kibdelosporangium banguiense TaxID=1365924 RepID=A0ABS4TET1_9PSEU|nr:hypothetical protein [Kibdelosporangium banguiense]MBP2322866.1 hypothetical protein [Kibdelosporangium banguiense]
MAGIDDVRRLKLRTVLGWGMDDLTELTHHRSSFDVATAAVRRLRRRARLFSLAGLALLVSFVLGAILIERMANELPAGGWRAEGVVTDKSSKVLDVRLTVDNVEGVVTVRLTGTSPDYQLGERVTVLYDPNGHGLYRTDDPPNSRFLTAVLMITALIGAVFLVPSGLIAGRRWGKRLRSVREHGWRSGRALVRRRMRGHTVLSVRMPDGDVLTVVTVRPVTLPLPMDLTASDVYVGGQGNALSIMFLTGPFVVAARLQRHHER